MADKKPAPTKVPDYNDKSSATNSKNSIFINSYKQKPGRPSKKK